MTEPRRISVASEAAFSPWHNQELLDRDADRRFDAWGDDWGRSDEIDLVDAAFDELAVD